MHVKNIVICPLSSTNASHQSLLAGHQHFVPYIAERTEPVDARAMESLPRLLRRFVARLSETLTLLEIEWIQLTAVTVPSTRGTRTLHLYVGYYHEPEYPDWSENIHLHLLIEYDGLLGLGPKYAQE